MMRILYAYPYRKGKVSFTYVAERHIATLRKAGFHVDAVDNSDTCTILEKCRDYDIVILHPATRTILNAHPKFLQKLVRYCRRLVAFDAFDTDMVNKIVSSILNMFDIVIVPSNYNAKILKSIGVTNIAVVPHYVDDWFARGERREDQELRKIEQLEGYKILFFLWHSWYRKGADVVLDAWYRLAKSRDDVWLIVKTGRPPCEYVKMFMFTNRTIVVPYILSLREIAYLYDISHIVLVPSRCGAFELNALEALIRERVTVVSECPCFREYYKHPIVVKTRKKVPVFYMNEIENLINNGFGWDPDPDDLYMKIMYILENYESIREKLRESFDYAKMFTEHHISELLIKTLQQLVK